MNHTPGPWFYSSNFRKYGQSAGIDVGAENGSNVALVHHDEHDREEKETKANACLIAAAPDLLEACKLALKYLPGYIIGSQQNKDRAVILASIAKAEGKS